MSDDIVTRLYDLCICCRCGCEQSCSECEAADEIERLQEELALWKKTAKHVRYHHCKPIGCRFCSIYAEEYPNDPVVE